MPIWKVDGRRFLDAGTVVVSGDAAIEIRIKYQRQRQGVTLDHEVALKFRTRENEEPDIQFANPTPNRTVVHFINYPNSETVAADGIDIGKIGDSDDLTLSYVVSNFVFAQPGNVWWLTYTLYAGVIKNG